MNEPLNYEALPGRLKSLYLGTVTKPNGSPFTHTERRTQLSRRFKVSPNAIRLPDDPVGGVREPVVFSGIGDRLKTIIEREKGAMPCGDCKQEVERLNRLTVAQVQEQRSSVAAAIIKRAKTKAKKWWQRWLIKSAVAVAPAAVKQIVLGWIDEACETRCCGIAPCVCQSTPVVSVVHVPIGRIVTAIRTAKRDEPTLVATVESMLAAGFEKPIIFGEPSSPDVVDVRWETQLRSFRSFFRCAQWMLDNTDAPWLLLCEDDVLFSHGLADHLRLQSLGSEVVTLFKPHGLPLSGIGLVPIQTINTSVAVLVRRNTLTQIVSSKTAATWPKPDCVDYFISAACRELGVTILSPVHSLTQHTGTTSVCQPGRWKKSGLMHPMRYASDFVEDVTLVMRRSLMFHCFPKLGTDWKDNCLSTFKYRHVFNGRLLISIVTGPDCEQPEQVAEWFQQFGPNLEIRYAVNVPREGINTTFRDQLQTMRNEPGIVFKAHTKGISHANTEPVWRNNMTYGCLSNIPLVEQKFREGYRTFGTFKTINRHGANVMGQLSGPWAVPWQGWHYPGAFFWFDPKFIPNSFFNLPSHHYENESFPCHMGPSETAFSVTANNIAYREPIYD